MVDNSSGVPDLSIIVPVHNAELHLKELVKMGSAIDVSVEWIFVDDASEDGSFKVLEGLRDASSNVRLLKLEQNSGAGVARNAGFNLARGRYTLFFDADDILHGNIISSVINRMDVEVDCDVAIFIYDYEREANASHTDMVKGDVEIWRNLKKHAKFPLGSLNDFPALLMFTNYPWNKIIRTDQYKKNEEIKFGSTSVHNDILGHWTSLLLARNILLVDEILCTHIVHLSGNNLTNAKRSRRMQVFPSLHELYDFVEAHPVQRQRYAHFYWQFVINLLNWAKPRVGEELRDEFNYEVQRLMGRIDLLDYAKMRTHRSPRVCDSIIDRVIK